MPGDTTCSRPSTDPLVRIAETPRKVAALGHSRSSGSRRRRSPTNPGHGLPECAHGRHVRDRPPRLQGASLEISGSSRRQDSLKRGPVRFTQAMADLTYIDETGSVGRGAKKQALLTLAAAVVHEDKVQRLTEAFRSLGWKHLGWLPSDFELHGNEIWNGTGHWKGKSPTELLAVYEDAIAVLDEFAIDVSYASIHKQRLHDRYGGGADGNAYLLALQFLLEKLERNYSSNKILIADEQKEHQLRAIKMVADLQDWGGGEVPGVKLKTVIDSMHFVNSHASPGVQLADLVAYALQRKWNAWDNHTDAKAAIDRIATVINNHTMTWREPWPAA